MRTINRDGIITKSSSWREGETIDFSSNRRMGLFWMCRCNFENLFVINLFAGTWNDQKIKQFACKGLGKKYFFL